MDIKDLKKDSSAIAQGQWVEDIPDMGELRLLVRGLSSKAVSQARSRKERSVPRKDRHRDGSLTHDTIMRISTELLAEEVLLDWSGITDGGKPVEYKKELATKWLTDPDYQDFANAVAWSAMVVDRGIEEAKETAAGN